MAVRVLQRIPALTAAIFTVAVKPRPGTRPPVHRAARAARSGAARRFMSAVAAGKGEPIAVYSTYP
ncbi:hypothetical protein AB0D12_07675 [Streptomyces sp. NPDC048479]|uniref:hypothetical protein n=1 Tax=Streptomyces sp. NPDC048479 TaxID=3154725 RepID=UPI003439499B